MPSSRPINISLSPNTLGSDIRLAARVLMKPKRWGTYRALQPKLEQRLEEIVGKPGVQLTSSGRSALYEALLATGISKGDEVIVQAFTCLAVPLAVQWAGATPVYIDIAPETLNIDSAQLRSKITPRTRAIIIQHTLGLPAPLPEILSMACEHNLLVIEDLAHSLGGTHQGQPLGSFGDIAILSFGRDKTISTVFGGAAVMPEKLPARPLPSARWAAQQLLHPLLVNAYLPLYFMADLGKILLFVSQRVGLLSLVVGKQEKTIGAKPYFIERSFHPALLPLLEKQLEQLPAFTKRRRHIAQRYLDTLGGSDYLRRVASDAAWLRFPLRVKDKRQALAAAKRAHIVLGDWYTTPVAPVPIEQQSLTQYVAGSCPNAEDAAAHIINLPTHPRMSDEDVERVIRCMENYIATEV